MTAIDELQNEINTLRSALRRMKAARLEAEDLLEKKSAELYDANKRLLDHQEQLEVTISERTRDLNDKVIQLEEIQRDLRIERDRARAESEGKTTAFAKLSHEIRTPLNGVLGTLNLLSDTDLNPEQLDILGLTLTSSEVLRSVLNDAIDLAKLEQGAMELETAEFDLTQWLDDLSDFWAGAAMLNQQTISVDYKNKLDTKVIADSSHLQQVMNNLLSNSIKYAEAGDIIISAAIHSVSEKTAVLSLSVTDRGKVIPVEEREILFDIYKRSKNEGHNDVGGGAGLGLTISLELVELMGGKLACIPAPDGSGNMFQLSIPVELGASLEVIPTVKKGLVKTSSGKPQIVAGQRKLRALIVEDVATNQLILERYMKTLGFRVDLANNGAEGVEAVINRPYDLILMDIAMPIMDGYEASNRIKGLGDGRADIPIIAVSAHVASDERNKALEAGIYAFLEKPIDRGKLEYVVSELFEKLADESISDTHMGTDNTFDAIMLQFQKDFAECLEAALYALQSNNIGELVLQMHKLSGLAGSFVHPRADKIKAIYMDLEGGCDVKSLGAAKDLLQSLQSVAD